MQLHIDGAEQPVRRLTQTKEINPALLTAKVDIRPAYQDADPAGVVWHGNYFHYFDAARVALLDRMDYGYREMESSGYLWPIVDTRVRYLASATYDQIITVEASLVEFEYRLKIGYAVTDSKGECITEAYTVQVPLNAATGEMCLGAPQPLLDRLAKIGIHAE